MAYTADRFLTSKYHEEDFIQVNGIQRSIIISQATDSGAGQRVFLTFEAIEELYEEVQRAKKEK